MRLFEDINYQFIGSRRKGYLFSAVLIALSLISFALHGLEVGIDFKGGMEFVVETETTIPVIDVRGTLSDALGEVPEVKTYQAVGGGDAALLIRTINDGETEINDVETQILQSLAAAYPDADPEVVKTDIVGPRFADDLRRGAIWSVVFSLLVIFAYIFIRFGSWRFGLGAVAALFHDVLITLGVFSLLHGFLPFSLQLDQTIIAAFLTIVGYSLNDTVVVFDRIREYTNLWKTEAYDAVVNRSINNTLSRTVVTSGTTLIVVLVLFILGGEVLRGFAFALIIGIMIGTYSSIFVASPIVVELHQRALAPARK